MVLTAQRPSEDHFLSRRLLAQHRRFLRGSKEAYAEIVDTLFPLLKQSLVQQFRGKTDEQTILSAIDIALMEYHLKPGEFDPSKGLSLARFLELAAERNVVKSPGHAAT